MNAGKILKNNLYADILKKKNAGKQSIAVLIDPDKTSGEDWKEIARLASRHKVDYLFVGGSRLSKEKLSECIKILKGQKEIPVVIFPGNEDHIDPNADALLLLSVISGRNPEMLIGKHVSAALNLLESGLEIIPTGYLLIDGGTSSSVANMSQTMPLSSSDLDTIVATALAGALLGMKLIYLEAGSGAAFPVHPSIISAVKKYLRIPLIIGGGINNPEKFQEAITAGADLIVIGNILEKEPFLLENFCEVLARKNEWKNFA